jgi:hypothetical protein
VVEVASIHSSTTILDLKSSDSLEDEHELVAYAALPESEHSSSRRIGQNYKITAGAAL